MVFLFIIVIISGLVTWSQRTGYLATQPMAYTLLIPLDECKALCLEYQGPTCWSVNFDVVAATCNYMSETFSTYPTLEYPLLTDPSNNEYKVIEEGEYYTPAPRI